VDKKIGTILSSSINCSSYLPDWRNDKDYKSSVSALKNLGGGVLLELSHEIDYSYWLFDDFISVYCFALNSGTLNIESEDIADIILVSKEHFPVNIHLDFNSRIYNRTCTVRGTKGNLIWDIFEKKIHLQRSNKNSEIIFSDAQNDMYYSQLTHFFDCIENNSEPFVTLNDGVASMRLIEASIKSSETGKVSYLS
jgi:predicted dehydrogenase